MMQGGCMQSERKRSIEDMMVQQAQMLTQFLALQSQQQQ